MDNQLSELLTLSLRTLFLLCVPITVAVAVGAALGGVLQSATGISDLAISYTVRLLVAVFAIYYYAPAVSEYIGAVVILAWGRI